MTEISATAGLCPKTVQMDFLSTLNGDGVTEVAFALPGTSKYNKAIYFDNLHYSDFQDILNSKLNVAFCGGFTENLGEIVPIKVETLRCGQDSYICQRSIISFDLDFKDNYHPYDFSQRNNLKQTTLSKLLEVFNKHQVSPWIILFSGNGLHVHFKLPEPLKIKTAIIYKKTYEAIQSYLECITGLKFDPACSNPSRLMRMPYSSNRKDAQVPVDCEVLYYSPKNQSDIWKQWAQLQQVTEVLDFDELRIDKTNKEIHAALNFKKVLEHYRYSKFSSFKERNGKIVCSSPFSKDTTPSFYYDSSKKVFFDFSNNFGGDLFTLISKLANLHIKNDFPKIIAIAQNLSEIKKAEPQLTSTFILNDAGVWFQTGQDANPRWLSCPIYVEALTRDANNNCWGRLITFCDQDKMKKTWAMPMDLLAGDGTEIRKNLLNLGAQLAVGFKERQLFLSYLQSSKPETRALCVNRMGWHHGQFVLPNQVFSPKENKQKILLQAKATELCMVANGDLIDWQNNVARLCKGNTRLILAISTAFAAPLLNLTNEESGGFHFVGNSSIGKSITLKVASSVWGNPGLKGFIKRWRATLNGLELLATSRCDSILILDELGELQPAQAGLAAYMLSGGMSKQRATKHSTLAEVHDWRLLFLSSGEISLSSHITQGGEQVSVGQEIRMIDIQAEVEKGFGVFEDIHGATEPGEFSTLLSNNSEQYYGTAIIPFLSKIVSDTGVHRFLEENRKLFIDKVQDAQSGQVHRILKRFSLVAAAGELAISYGILPWEKGVAIDAVHKIFLEWQLNWSPVASKEFAHFLSHTKSLLQEYGASRFPLIEELRRTTTTPNPSIQKLWGFRQENEDGQEWIILSEVFRNHFIRNMDYKRCIKLLKEHNLLIKSSMPMRVPHLGLTRVISISDKIMA